MTPFAQRTPVRFTLSAFALALLAACGKPAAPPAATPAPEAAPKAAEAPAPAPLTSGIDKANFDTAVRAQDDLWITHVPGKFSGPIGSVALQIRLRNALPVSRKVRLEQRLVDGAGALVTTTKVNVKLSPGGQTETGWRPAFNFAYPRLWNGTSDPYQYSVVVNVFDGKRLIDTVTQSFGIRTATFDPNKGFSLNFNPLPLHGVSRHQDRQGKGWALTAADHAEDMALIRELGANTVRHAHYQHDDAWSDEADKAGMIVWAELPYVTSPGLNGGQGSPELWANAEQQLRELIRQNYNHPSIAMWSVGNEVDSAKGFGKATGDPLPLLKHLAAVAKQEDPSRPTTFADCCEDLSIMGMTGQVKLAGATDLIGYNRYHGWYMPEPLKARAQLGVTLDKLHAKHPTLPMSLSEWGAGGALSQHSDDVTSGFLNFIGRPQPEEYQAYAIEQNWLAIRERKYLYASWLWNMFDFASDLRGEGDSFDINTKGLVSFDRDRKSVV